MCNECLQKGQWQKATKKMTRFEIGQFSDKRKMLLVRFQSKSSNIRINDNGEITWVPTLQEAEQLYEVLAMTNFYNLNKDRIVGLGEAETNYN
jgi:hypothetical protein